MKGPKELPGIANIITDEPPPVRPPSRSLTSLSPQGKQPGHPPYTKINVLRDGNLYAYHLYGDTHEPPSLEEYDVLPERVREVVRGLDAVSIENVTRDVRERMNDPRLAELRAILLSVQVKTPELE